MFNMFMFDAQGMFKDVEVGDKVFFYPNYDFVKVTSVDSDTGNFIITDRKGHSHEIDKNGAIVSENFGNYPLVFWDFLKIQIPKRAYKIKVILELLSKLTIVDYNDPQWRASAIIYLSCHNYGSARWDVKIIKDLIGPDYKYFNIVSFKDDEHFKELVELLQKAEVPEKVFVLCYQKVILGKNISVDEIKKAAFA